MPMVKEFSYVVEKDEDGWFVATVLGLPGCHTQAKSLDQLLIRVREAIELCQEVHGRRGKTNEFVGVQRVKVGT
jgi:predicted RNase H-like HicB family nuclease